jgi:hypothetical protein
MSEHPTGRQPVKTAEEIMHEAERLRDTLEKLRRELTDLLAKSRELTKSLPPNK